MLFSQISYKTYLPLLPNPKKAELKTRRENAGSRSTGPLKTLNLISVDVSSQAGALRTILMLLRVNGGSSQGCKADSLIRCDSHRETEQNHVFITFR